MGKFPRIREKPHPIISGSSSRIHIYQHFINIGDTEKELQQH